MKIWIFKFQGVSSLVILITITFLVLNWVFVILTDVLGYSSIIYQEILQGHPIPLLWFHLFGEGSLTEIFQWTALATSFLISTYCHISLKVKGKKEIAYFFFLVGTGVLLMFLEDTLNIRHKFGIYLGEVAGYSYLRNPVKIATEFLFYTLIGTLMVFPLWKYWRFLSLSRRTKTILIIGYSSYFIASVASASRYLMSWYDLVGGAFISFLPLQNVTAWEMAANNLEQTEMYPLGFWLMDYLFEESIELVGAGFLLAFFLTYAFERNHLSRASCIAKKPR